MDQESLIERLMAENEEFRRLRGEHRAYDQELETLKGTPRSRRTSSGASAN